MCYISINNRAKILREKPIGAYCPRAQASIGGCMLVVRSTRGLPHKGSATTAAIRVRHAMGLLHMSSRGKLVGAAGFESHTEKAISACYCAFRIYLYPQKYPQISRDDHSRARALVSRQLCLPHRSLDLILVIPHFRPLLGAVLGLLTRLCVTIA